MRLAVFCSGNGSNFQAILDAVSKKKLKASIALMVCDDPKAYAIQRAARGGVPIAALSPKLFKDRVSYEKFLVQLLKNQNVDLIVLAGFMRILTPYFIRAYKNRVVNIHPSYLPAFKGAHAILDAFDAEVATTGVTVHIVTAKVDAGPILMQEKVPVRNSDTLATLEARIHKVEHKLYPKAIQKYLRRLG